MVLSSVIITFYIHNVKIFSIPNKIWSIVFLHIHNIIIKLWYSAEKCLLFSYNRNLTLQIECLFLTLTSLGRDLQNELPAMFKKLFSIIKVVFLKGANEQQIQKIFLQLMELRLANWQLPVSALNYYYPKSSR